MATLNERYTKLPQEVIDRMQRTYEAIRPQDFNLSAEDFISKMVFSAFGEWIMWKGTGWGGPGQPSEQIIMDELLGQWNRESGKQHDIYANPEAVILLYVNRETHYEIRRNNYSWDDKNISFIGLSETQYRKYRNLVLSAMVHHALKSMEKAGDSYTFASDIRTDLSNIIEENRNKYYAL
jgi:hypothetical protein